MVILKPYKSISNYLHRFTLIKVGKLHIRLHRILSKDMTTLYHNHPFNYISIILFGGYKEKVLTNNKEQTLSHKFLSIIKRDNTTYHRIEQVKKNTITLFITYKNNNKWNAINTITNHKDNGIHKRKINNKEVYSKKENGIWFIGNKDYNIAKKEIRHSIHQI